MLVPGIPQKAKLWPEGSVLREAFKDTVRNAPVAENYQAAMWHIPFLKEQVKVWPLVTEWLDQNAPKGLQWYSGRVWWQGLVDGTLAPFLDAMRMQELPIILVGPERIRGLGEVIGVPIKWHFQIALKKAVQQMTEIKEGLLAFDKPALICFSAGAAGKLVIHDLYPQIGHHSYLIDFGAVWEGLMGMHTRTFHKTVLTPKALKRSLARGMNIKRAAQIHGQMKPNMLRWLASQASKCEKIVEVGVLAGRSTRAMLDNSNAHVWCVDSWCFDGAVQMKKTFFKNMIGVKGRDRISVLHMLSVDAAEVLRKKHGEGYFDMVFIDGSHDYKSVREDIIAWRPLLRPGGLLAGHDYHAKRWNGVVQAVEELVPDRKIAAGTIWWTTV